MVRAEQKTNDYQRDRERWGGPIEISETELGFLGVTASAVIRQQTKGQYPAPDAALETVMEGALLDEEAACELEAANMSRLFGSPVNAALLNVFFLTDRNKKDVGVAEPPAQIQEFQSVADDITVPRRWWQSRLLRIFLAFLLPTIGSFIGTWVGGTRIISNLF